MTRYTWAALAALQSSHAHLDAFDLDLSDVPESSRQAVLIRELGELHQANSPCQSFAGTIGFAVDADGVTVSDIGAAERAHALCILLEDECSELHDGPGPVASAIGYGRAKQAEKDASLLGQIAGLVVASQGASSDLPRPSAAAVNAVRIRALSFRLAIAA